MATRRPGELRTNQQKNIEERDQNIQTIASQSTNTCNIFQNIVG